MNDINKLVYFLNSIKETLPFEDENDFRKKICNRKEFRIRIQKLVYLSKFFGWENSYIFTLHERGPYSINLSEAYHDKRLFKNKSMKISEFKTSEFAGFVKGKSNEFLEASSTILYVFRNNIDSFNEESCIKILSELKPFLSVEVILDSYNSIEKFNLITEKTTVISSVEIEDAKAKMNHKIKNMKIYVDPLEICRNQTLILGSLEYMRIIMNIENASLNHKKDLLNFIEFYTNAVEGILDTCKRNDEDFKDIDLTLIEKLFDQFQNYVSQELNIIPRVDDEEFDYSNYY